MGESYNIPRPNEEDERVRIYECDHSDFEENRSVSRERTLIPPRVERDIKIERFGRDVDRKPFEPERYTRSTECFAPAPRASLFIPQPRSREEEDFQMIRRSEVVDDRQVARGKHQQEEDYHYERWTRKVEDEESNDNYREERIRRGRTISLNSSVPQHRHQGYSIDDSIVDSEEISGRSESSKTSSSIEYYPNYSPTYEGILPHPRQHGFYSCIVPSCPSQARFRRLADLEQHQITVHSPKLIDCPHGWCGRTGRHGFTRKNHLRDHLKEVHMKDITPQKRLARGRSIHRELTEVRSGKDRSYRGVSHGDSATSLADKSREKITEYHRTSVACERCRTRKTQCLLAPDDAPNRCFSCTRAGVQCEFYPVDQQFPVERRPRTDSKVNGQSGETLTSSSSSPPLMGGQNIELVDNSAQYPPLPVSPPAQDLAHSLAPSSSSIPLQNPILDQKVGDRLGGDEPGYATRSTSRSTTSVPSSTNSPRHESANVQMHHDFMNPDIKAQQVLQSMTMVGPINCTDRRKVLTLISSFEMPALRLRFQSLLQHLGLMEPLFEKGKTRIRYHCQCGKEVFGDYQELHPGAAGEWQERLNHHFEIKRNTSGSGEAPCRNKGLSHTMKNFITFFGFQGTGGKPLSQAPGLPLMHNPSEPDPIQRPNSQMQVVLKFLLLCVKHKKWAIKLRHANACNITSDVQLFRILAAEYRAARHRSVFSLRKLASINFLQFEALQKAETVGVRKVPDYPPESNHDYDYKPRPLDLIPPNNENEMMHYFHCPDDALDIPLFLERIPIKLNGRLDLSGGHQTGWGIIFNDGISWKKVWIMSFFGMLSSAIADLVWWSVRNDAQGASAISAITAPLVLVTMGAIQGYLGEIG